MGGLTNDRVDSVVALLARYAQDTRPRLVACDDNGQLLVSLSGGSITQPVASRAPTSQVALLANTVTLLVAARANRLSVIIQNLSTQDIYIGEDNLVTTSSGLLLLGTVGTPASLHYTGDIYGISAGASRVSVMELY